MNEAGKRIYFHLRSNHILPRSLGPRLIDRLIQYVGPSPPACRPLCSPLCQPPHDGRLVNLPVSHLVGHLVSHLIGHLVDLHDIWYTHIKPWYMSDGVKKT